MGIYENFDEQKQFACRVIADHARTTVFAIADGILPGNEGRNYVLRKIMRRAIYHGREHLTFDGLFFNKVCDFVVGQMKDAYPELEVQREFIGKMVRMEEERFGNTLTVGLKKLEELLEKNDFEMSPEDMQNPHKPYPGNLQIEELAKLYDTYGLPVDLMFVVLRSKYPTQPDYDPLERFSFWTLTRRIGKFPDDAKVERFSVVESIGYLDDDMNVVPYGSIVLINEERFRELIDDELKNLQESTNLGKTQQYEKINPIYKSLERTSVRSRFLGYDTTRIEDAKVITIVKGDLKAEQLNEGDEGLIVLDQTPFYAEAGGQVGDAGTLVRTAYGSGRLNAAFQNDEALESHVKPPATAGGSDLGGESAEGYVKPPATAGGSDLGGESAEGYVKPPATAGGSDISGEPPATAGGSDLAAAIVIDTFAPIPGITLHKSKVNSGSIKVGDTVTATVDAEKRDATRRNHTATHLVHAALKEVLGTHVKQAGSVVAPNYLRFDFTHYQQMSAEEVREVEDLVNHYILRNEPVNTDLMAIEEAMRSGAVAMFGEKYGSEVRVLSVGGGEFSKELCGGTHVRATGDIGSFKITADEAIASGVRRIRAITGFDAFRRFREDELLIDRSLGFLKTQRDQLPAAIEKMQDELKKTRREIEELKLKIAAGSIGSVSANGDEAKDVGGVQVLAKAVGDLDKGGMRQLSDTLLGKIKSGVVILGREEEGKVSFIVRVSDDLTARISAGNIVKEMAPIVGGRGGGKPDMAEGGGLEPDKLNEAIEASYGIVEKMLG